MLVSSLILMDRTDRAARVIANVPIPPPQQLWQYKQIHDQLINAYIHKEQVDKAIALFWTFCERTQPNTINTRRVSPISSSSRAYYSGYTPIQSNYPSVTTYYGKDRLAYLQNFFRQLWMQDQHEQLYTKFRSKFDTAEDINRIYTGLALSYCYWWGGARDKAQEVLSTLQKGFSE